MSLLLLELTLEVMSDILLAEKNGSRDDESHQRSQEHEPPVQMEVFHTVPGCKQIDSSSDEITNEADNPTTDDDSISIVILFHLYYPLI